MDLDRIVADLRDPDMPWSDGERFFFNWNRKGEDKAVDPALWERQARPELNVEAGELVALGFDGSIYDDSTALLGCTPEGHIFRLKVWSRPHGVKDWRVPRGEVHAAVLEAKETYGVGRMYCDPAKWWTEIEEWDKTFGVDINGDPIVVIFDTNQPSRMAPACDRLVTGISEGSTTHDGDETVTAHVLAMARKKVRLRDDDDDGRTRFVFVKSDTRKIDAGIAAVLAREAASTLIENQASVYEDRGLLVV